MKFCQMEMIWVCIWYFLLTRSFVTFIDFYYCTLKKNTIHYKASHLASMSESSISKQIAHSYKKQKDLSKILQFDINFNIFFQKTYFLWNTMIMILITLIKKITNTMFQSGQRSSYWKQFMSRNDIVMRFAIQITPFPNSGILPTFLIIG